MASIKNLSLKAITKRRGHEEEELIEANIYFNNKKVGTYKDLDWGGGTETNIEEEYRVVIDKIENDYLKENPDKYQLKEMIYFDLLELTMLEKEFNKICKKGYDRMFIINDKKEELSWNDRNLVINSKGSSIDGILDYLKRQGKPQYKKEHIVLINKDYFTKK